MGEWAPEQPAAGSEATPPSTDPGAEGSAPASADTSGPAVDGQAPPTDDSAAEDAADDDGALPAQEGEIPEPSATPTRRGAREMAKVLRERDEYLEQLKRTKADFENYRKRILRQQTEHLERAAEALIEKLLPVLDNFDAAINHGSGYEQVHASFMGVLEREGLGRINPVGEQFDPNEADAVAHEHGDGGPVVAEVLRPGYRWKGRVLRPAMVKVKG